MTKPRKHDQSGPCAGHKSGPGMYCGHPRSSHKNGKGSCSFSSPGEYGICYCNRYVPGRRAPKPRKKAAFRRWTVEFIPAGWRLFYKDKLFDGGEVGLARLLNRHRVVLPKGPR